MIQLHVTCDACDQGVVASNLNEVRALGWKHTASSVKCDLCVNRKETLMPGNERLEGYSLAQFDLALSKMFTSKPGRSNDEVCNEKDK